MPGKNTTFEPLWVDKENALEILEAKKASGSINDSLAEKIGFLINYGYVVLPAAISTDLADQLMDEINHVADEPEYYIARRSRMAYTYPTRDIYDDPTFRLIDYHVNSKLARQTAFCPAIVEILRCCFEAPVNAFQCLTFNYGSQQAMHQDGAYVVVSKPLQFMASWVALEDVTPGSGELQYFVGSHKLDDFLFGRHSKSWLPEKHGKEIHQQFLKHLEDIANREDMPLEKFLPKKGDALIWASDLVHGGSKLENGLTRRSIVTHYCPLGVKPNFLNFSGYYAERKVNDDCYFSSRHYDLRPGSKQRKVVFPSLQARMQRVAACLRAKRTPDLEQPDELFTRLKPAFMGKNKNKTE